MDAAHNQCDQGPIIWFLKYFSWKNLQKYWHFLFKLLLVFENVDHNIGFWEKRQFFRRKLSKIDENNDHNIDPRSEKIAQNLAPIFVKISAYLFTCK
jgi:hypothetical protein